MDKSTDKELSSTDHARILAEFKQGFDPVQAETEYRAMLKNGGVTWEQLMHDLVEIDRRKTKKSA